MRRRTSPVNRHAERPACAPRRFLPQWLRLGRGGYLISITTIAVILAPEGLPTAQAQSALTAPPALQGWSASHATAASPEVKETATESSSRSASLDLVQAYERMLLNDPQVHAARAARDAGRDAGNIARAALLPQASINYLRNRTRQTEYYDTPSAGRQSIDDRYYGRRAGLTIEQTLFDYSAISTYRMGKTQAEYAEVQYRLQFQQEAVALIDAYLNAVLARDSLALARHQLRIYQDMLRDNERMMAEGEGTRIDILETRTQVGATESELVTYENDLADRLRELSALLGSPVQAHELMAVDLEALLPPLADDDLATLLADARQQNPEVQAARLAVRYNDLTVEREKGQFMPRVSLYAAHERIVSDTVNNRGRDYKTNTIGLQVSIPLFSGGSSYYSTRQATNRLVQSRYELERTANTTTTTLEQYYRVFHTSPGRVRTLRRNVADATALVQAMRKSVAGGERTNTDALQAERQSYQAQQSLLRTYVEWFQAYAKLQFYAGRFSEDDVLVLNRHLLAQAR
ncbi:TolC family outer membrane protein [Pseudomonas aeruginosa]|uniref:TolC family outer membrane protein n=1 Tax=Pseudomonas aeruginosa TaxID=287 RepID=UPI0029357AC5|nr:TolC family outer membrane protein [Pseudomonas aeruginosa]MDV2646537.1 TolC family outer membrane protein [Pseudomonas aeruginosa]MDV2778570.1 TolC family outer membrane protein [Pseudomonas aeruginosa]